MNTDARLIRYQVLAANRRHFSTLFFAVVAFSWIFGLGLWMVLRWAYPAFPALAFLAAGAILIANAFVAQRLFKRERSAFEAMCACWRSVSDDQPTEAAANSSSLRPGAMAIVTAALFVAGICLSVIGVVLA